MQRICTCMTIYICTHNTSCISNHLFKHVSYYTNNYNSKQLVQLMTNIVHILIPKYHKIYRYIHIPTHKIDYMILIMVHNLVNRN